MDKGQKRQREWVDKLLREEVGLHRLPEEWDEYERAATRLEAVTLWSNKPELKDRIKKNGVVRAAAGKNCEQMVGELTVPLGVAGPLRLRSGQALRQDSGQVRSGQADEEVWVPLATTEGALVASVQRGMKGIKLAGGVRVMATNQGMSRAQLVRVEGIEHGQRVIDWLDNNRGRLIELAEGTSHHLKFIDGETQLVGRNLFVRFSFDTGEAMGMNMVTIAVDKLVREIESQTKAKCVALSGNYCVDKKPAWSNFIKGRGMRVQAEVVLSKEIIRETLKTTPEAIEEVVKRKLWLGSMISGSMGFNGHYANIAAAIFMATGQDMAHVVEASLGVTTAEMDGEGLYFSVMLPDLVVGTVGGGTGLPVQKACLELMGVGMGKDGEKEKLASIIGGSILAGELSLTAALASGQLAQAHQNLGRSRI